MCQHDLVPLHAGWWMQPAAVRWPRVPAQSALASAAAGSHAKAAPPVPMPAPSRPAAPRVRVLSRSHSFLRMWDKACRHCMSALGSTALMRMPASAVSTSTLQ